MSSINEKYDNSYGRDPPIIRIYVAFNRHYSWLSGEQFRRLPAAGSQISSHPFIYADNFLNKDFFRRRLKPQITQIFTDLHRFFYRGERRESASLVFST
jgi:hypothetical protein